MRLQELEKENTTPWKISRGKNRERFGSNKNAKKALKNDVNSRNNKVAHEEKKMLLFQKIQHSLRTCGKTKNMQN